jgi:hypothetical protein
MKETITADQTKSIVEDISKFVNGNEWVPGIAEALSRPGHPSSYSVAILQFGRQF